ncbi:sensor histidine kinase [Kribbella sp. CA-293567]|uniref:sensor histidine kinase n=1 Tax=Kribbella sp. CA-293567 TaxID=3002436 RepID=UPI0022DD5B43|nr:histidine kinase [Kribbella sp. CA-293567]WBQ06181.1 histidine kinase [Kribbella sp. CA-293567]
MEPLRNWLLPAVLGIAWVAATPGLTAFGGTPMTGRDFVIGSAASVVAVIALGFRRRTPLAALGVVTLVTVLGQLATSPDALGVLPAEGIVLYSVAVRCSPAVSRRAAAALLAVKTVASLGFFGLGVDFALESVGNLVLYVVILAGGQNRRRRLLARERAAQQVRDAEERRRNAAAVERHRLARELHDVSAHHLTSIVVSGSAAERLIDRRPELADEALAYAARTGRETLESLRRLVAVLETGERDQDEPLGGRIAELAEAFTRLGQQVLVEVTPELTGPVAEATFGIVRESLTNTLRHAPGAAVRVLVSQHGDRVDVLVENGQATAAPQAGQGSGRGIGGMRDRAEAVGGTLSAGPGPDNTWQVKASFPLVAAYEGAVDGSAAAGTPSSGVAGQPSRRVAEKWQDRWLSDVGVVLTVTATGVGGTAALIFDEVPEGRPVAVYLALLVALIPGLVLLERRIRPWLVLAGVTASCALWPVAIGFGLLPDELAPALAMCVGALMAAVYAVAVYAPDANQTVASVAVAAGGFGLAAGVLAMITATEEDMSGTEFGGFMSTLVTIALAVPLLVCWAAGAFVRRRRSRRLDHRGRELAELVRASEAEVHAERQRIATGLHGTVLTRTSRMIALAEAGQIDGVTAEARSALTAMRELLETLDEPGTVAPRTPQPIGKELI